MTSPTSHVPSRLRARIQAQARYRCGYCLRHQDLLGMPLTIDHIIPQVAGGQTIEENLWLACHRCNRNKSAQTHALDPETGERIGLFNPRQQILSEHFKWNQDGTHILGTTPCGRATVIALNLNNAEIVLAPQRWVSVGWWPPQD